MVAQDSHYHEPVPPRVVVIHTNRPMRGILIGLGVATPLWGLGLLAALRLAALL